MVKVISEHKRHWNLRTMALIDISGL